MREPRNAEYRELEEKYLAGNREYRLCDRLVELLESHPEIKSRISSVDPIRKIKDDCYLEEVKSFPVAYRGIMSKIYTSSRFDEARYHQLELEEARLQAEKDKELLLLCKDLKLDEQDCTLPKLRVLLDYRHLFIREDGTIYWDVMELFLQVDTITGRVDLFFLRQVIRASKTVEALFPHLSFIVKELKKGTLPVTTRLDLIRDALPEPTKRDWTIFLGRLAESGSNAVMIPLIIMSFPPAQDLRAGQPDRRVEWSDELNYFVRDFNRA